MGSWSTFSVPSSVGSFSPDTTLLLTDGSILIHDAYGAAWVRLSPDGQGNYESGAWSSELSMVNTRQFFASGILPDGRVFVVGGEYSNAESSGSDGPLAEFFDPQTNTWTSVSKPAAFNYIQGDCSGCVLADGRVLLGNLQTTSPPFSTALWDPVTNVWTVAGSGFGALSADSKSANCNEETWNLLPDGSVLTVDTLNEPHSERYIPSLDQWVSTGNTPSNLVLTTITDSSGTVVSIFEIGPAILLPDGRLFAVGGSGQTALYTPPPVGSDPTTTPGTWVAGPTFPSTPSGSVWPTLTNSDAPGVLQTNGKVLCTGGQLYEIPATSTSNADYFSENAQFFEFDPSDNSLSAFTPAPLSSSSAPNTWQIRFLLLPNAQILMTAQSGEMYLYTPDAAENDPDSSWRPTLTSFPQTLVQGHTYTVTGTQLNGLSQAVSYGDDAQQATNYPIFRLSSGSQVVYLRSSNFSTLGVATGSTPVTADIEVPSTITPGTWQMVAIANGIPSDPVEVQVVAQDCYLILDRDTFGEGEIQAMINLGGAPAVVSPALYVVIEGYSANDIGLTTANLGNPPHKPDIPSPIGGLTAVFNGPVLPEDPALPAHALQRFTFPFSLQFTGESVFAGAPQTLTVHASFTAPGQPSVSNQGLIYLIANPDPFILHGDEASGYQWYLSTDLRVFQLNAGGTRFGATLGTSGSPDDIATTFIQAVISNLEGDPAAAGSLFDAIAQDETSTALSLVPVDSGGPYNFALARVRLQDVAAAHKVGVFFRLWQAQQTNATYDPSTLYQSIANPAGDVVPLLGVEGDEIITIPFFATTRVESGSVSMQTQSDTPNRKTIHPDPLGAETDAYFGCWLDINMPGELRFPDRMVGGSPVDIPAGPFTGMGTLQSIQQLIRSTHQCLIAEISFAPDPVQPGSDPSNSDKLAQRNLTLIPAPNPGTPESRRVPQTLLISPTSPALPVGLPPDELMVDWGDIPVGTTAQLYLPAASALEVLALADTMYASHLLSVIDPHTVQMTAGAVTYVPVPASGAANLAGLFTVDLPTDIHDGQQFAVVVKQLTGAGTGGDVTNRIAGVATEAGGARRSTWRRVSGVFNLDIPISTKHALLGNEERTLSIMRWIGQSISTQSIWYPVFARYLLQLAGRVSQMGGIPGEILPSPSGIWTKPGAGGHGGRGTGHGEHGGPFDHLVECTGKIEGLVHDRFGDFEGFLLEERRNGEILRFWSREAGIAKLAERAWRYRTTVSVFVEPHRREVPAVVVLRESTDWD